MAYVKVAEISELTVGNKMKVVVEGKEILLTNVNGSYYAISNKCPHMGGSLSEGKLEGSTIICPKHGSKFDVMTGKVIQDPKILFIKIKVKADPSYLVKVEGNDILVDIS